MLYLFAVKNTVSAFFFSIGNYSEAVNDAKNAIELQPSFLKAFIRGKSTVVICTDKVRQRKRWNVVRPYDVGPNNIQSTQCLVNPCHKFV